MSSFFLGGVTHAPLKNVSQEFWKYSKSEKSIFWKNTSPNQKSKENRPPQNHPKNWPDWQSQVISAIFKGVMAIFLNFRIMEINIAEKNLEDVDGSWLETWRTGSSLT